MTDDLKLVERLRKAVGAADNRPGSEAAFTVNIRRARTLLATTEPTPDAALRAIHEQQGG